VFSKKFLLLQKAQIHFWVQTRLPAINFFQDEFKERGVREMRKSRMIPAPVCSPGYISICMVEGVRGEGVSFSSRAQAKNMIIQSAREKEAISWS
jgi:hypothetical protein